MGRLRVKYKGVIVSDVPLDVEREYIVGKKETCEIKLLPEKGISREHIRVKWNGISWELETLSKYGEVLAKGERIERLSLLHGETFAIPPYEFEYLETSSDSPQENAPQGQAAQPIGDKTVVGVANVLPYLRFIDENNETKELFCLESGESWIAGRDASAQIEIKDRRVSRRQFEIRRAGASYTILDLGSANGTIVNGQPISSTDPLLLKSGDTISVLNNFFVFELRDPNFKSRAELVSLPPIPMMDSPPAGTEDSTNSPPPGFFTAEDVAAAEAAAKEEVAEAINQQSQDSEEKKQQEEAAKKTKTIRLALAVCIILVFAYFFTQDNKPPPPSKTRVSTTDPYEKLPADKKLMVKQIHQLSLNYLMQGKYDLCFTQIAKLYEFLPPDYTYLNSKEIEQQCKISLEVQEEKRRQEEREKAQRELQEKVEKTLAHCRTLINPNLTQEQLDECLAPILAIAPEHPAFAEMKAQIEAFEAERKLRQENQAKYQALVAKLKRLFRRANRIYKTSSPLRAIKAFEVVVDSKLPDPGDLKGTSKRKIASIKTVIQEKIDAGLAEADKLYQEQKIKEAILALREVRLVDPSNEDVKNKIETYTLELKKQMRVIYQEGILEENYGNVESGNNKEGAKDKWKKIMEKDIPDGEYYIKAKIKLRKYGEIKKTLPPINEEPLLEPEVQ